jgi:arsenite-transporting ATPase
MLFVAVPASCNVGANIRVIIYTGKGGVGKTSVAAATALRSAALGHRTCVISTDQAHSLADSMEVTLSGTVKNIAPNLDAIEIDVLYEMETRWKEINKYISDFLASQGMEGVSVKEMTVWPGMELISALFYIWDYKRSKKYDVVIIDTAPTGETLRLLSFPDISNWYLERLYNVVKNMIRLARATVGRVMNTPLPSDDFLRDVNKIRHRLVEVKDILIDPEQTSVRLVVNPERMVISETKRAFTYLCLYNLTVEALIINRLLPSGLSTGEYFKEKLKEQEKYMEIINESFTPLKMLEAYQLPTELVGRKSLEKLADMLFQDTDPTQIYSTEKPLEIFNENGVDILAIKLPFSTKGEVELYKTNDVLIIKVGWYKRSIVLPFTLAKQDATKAEFRDDRLLIKFEGGKTIASKEKANEEG